MDKAGSFPTALPAETGLGGLSWAGALPTSRLPTCAVSEPRTVERPQEQPGASPTLGGAANWKVASSPALIVSRRDGALHAGAPVPGSVPAFSLYVANSVKVL